MKNPLKKNLWLILPMMFVTLQSFSAGSVLLLVLVVAVIFAVMLVRASKNSGAQAGDSLEMQLRDSISKARRIVFKAQNDINKFANWANQAISDALGQYINKYDLDKLYEQFDNIKQDLADKLEPHQWQKLEEIVKGYIAQIELKKAEMKAAETIKEKYEKLLEQIKESKKQESKKQKLEKHSQRLEQLNQSTDTTKELIEQDLNYDMIKNEVEQKVIYLEELEKLQLQSGSNQIITDTKVYEQELNKILNNLN